MRILSVMLGLSLAVLMCCNGPAERSADVSTTADLYRSTVRAENTGGKDLIMAFDELSRDAKTSTARVTFQSGASVLSIMFAIRGFYDIARERGETHFVNLKEWEDEDGNWMYLVGFTSDSSIDVEDYFGVSGPFPGSDKVDPLMSVADFSLIFSESN